MFLIETGGLLEAVEALDFADNDVVTGTDVLVDAALASDEFASIQFIIDVLLLFRDNEMDLDALNNLTITQCSTEEAFFAFTSSELTITELTLIINSATSIVSIQIRDFKIE